jgi:hypothetical protein
MNSANKMEVMGIEKTAIAIWNFRHFIRFPQKSKEICFDEDW